MVPKKIEDQIAEFVRRARETAGANLESIVLYGSAANGEYHEEFSDVNLLCVVGDSSYAALQKLSPVAKWWRDQKQPAPLIMTRGEIEHATDVFSIELMDMQKTHKVLMGPDVVSELVIPRKLHRVQVEYELREKLVLLRQRALIADGNEKILWELMVQSVASFSTLARHALIALGKPAPTSRREAISQLASAANFDAAAFVQVLDVREKKSDTKKIDVKELFARYLAAVEKVAVAVDEALG